MHPTLLVPDEKVQHRFMFGCALGLSAALLFPLFVFICYFMLWPTLGLANSLNLYFCRYYIFVDLYNALVRLIFNR